jgi:hypothetical protein
MDLVVQNDSYSTLLSDYLHAEFSCYEAEKQLTLALLAKELR